MLFRIVSLLIVLLIGQLPMPASQSDLTYQTALPIVSRQLPAPSEAEPNNSRAQANGPLTYGISYYGMQDNDLDRYDLYYFEVTAAGNIRITLENPPRGDLQLQLHDGTTVLPLKYDYDAPFEINYTISRTGKYYLLIYFPTGYVSSMLYALKVFTP